MLCAIHDIQIMLKISCTSCIHTSLYKSVSHIDVNVSTPTMYSYTAAYVPNKNFFTCTFVAGANAAEHRGGASVRPVKSRGVHERRQHGADAVAR